MLTPAELIERRRYIGGSDVAAILGLNPYRNVTDVYLEKINQLTAEATTSRPADLGNRLEPILVQLAAEHFGEPAELNRRFNNDWMSAQTDGWMDTRHEPIEAKAIGLFNPRFNRNEWGAEHTDEIPFLYLTQVLWQLHVTGANTGHVSALLGGGLGHRIYTINRNDELIAEIVSRVHSFWHNNVLPRIAPEQPASLDTYKQVIREPDTYAQIDPELPLAYEAAIAAVTTAEQQRDALKARVLQQMGSADIGTSPYGEFHYKANKRGVRSFRYKEPNHD
jgi:putative phage-type endonuclease